MKRGLAPILIATLSACGTEIPGTARDAAVARDASVRDAIMGEAGGCGPTSAFMPLVIGAAWTYNVRREDGSVVIKRSEVVAEEEIGGLKGPQRGYRFRTRSPSGTVLSWFEFRDCILVRHREQELDTSGTLTSDESYFPYRYRFDETPEHLVNGATYSLTYEERKLDGTRNQRTETWTVEATDELVTVAAGTFPCVRLRREVGGSSKRYWFSRGIGKVREEGGQVEELTAYSIPAAT